MEENTKKVTPKSQDFSRWYTDVILRAELADYSPVKGCMIIRPYGYAIWEHIQQALDKMIKKGGVKNAYFPLFIPESFLRKEKEHVEGFSPELAVVTIGGGEELKEKLVVRPTSETIMYDAYAKWVQSWRDLPVLINQWNNVVRWEKRTYLFLRTTEFLWQEGHTVHETHDEALEMVHKALTWYRDLYRDFFAIEGIMGVKSEAEKFAGARKTFTFEMLMPDGKALQGCTSHDLGQNFAKAFGISFLGRDEKTQTPWQTSWGLSTRSMGALIMSHGDDKGLILPPKLTPTQVVIVPIFKKDVESEELVGYCQKIKKDLEAKEVRVELDARIEQSAGWKYNEWEMKGVPIRIEVGEREMKAEKVTLVSRTTGEKTEVPTKEVLSAIEKLLEQIQKDLLEKTSRNLQENTREVNSYEEFKEIMKTKKGFIKAFWCEGAACEEKIKEETKASSRCLPLDAEKESGKCVYCGRPATHRWIFAQSY